MKSTLARFFAISILYMPNLFPVIYTHRIWRDPKDKHLVISFGDVHLHDKDSCNTQYEIFKGALNFKKHRLIVEDKIFRSNVAIKRTKGQVLSNISIWSIIAGCNAKPIEFRCGTNLIPGTLEGIGILRQIIRTKKQKNEYYEHKEHIINQFDKFGKKATHNMLWRIWPELKPGYRYKLDYTNAHIHHLLDLSILDEIAKSKKNEECAVVVAGGWHVDNIATPLENAGYQEISRYTSSTLGPFTQSTQAEWDKLQYKTECKYYSPIRPISIANTYNKIDTPNKDSKHKISLREKLVLSYLKRRGRIEQTSTAHVHRFNNHLVRRTTFITAAIYAVPIVFEGGLKVLIWLLS